MEEMRKIDAAIDYLKSKKPDELARIMKEVNREYPDTIHHLMCHVAKGDHITNHQEYYDCINELHWMDHKGHGEKIPLDEVVRMAEKLIKIDFQEEEYTEFDYAYLVNMLYAIFCLDFEHVTTFLKMAKRIFDYSKLGYKEQYGAFFRPIKKHHHSDYQSEYSKRSYPHNYSEYGYDEDNRRGHPHNENYKTEHDYRHSEYRHNEKHN